MAANPLADHSSPPPAEFEGPGGLEETASEAVPQLETFRDRLDDERLEPRFARGSQRAIADDDKPTSPALPAAHGEWLPTDPGPPL